MGRKNAVLRRRKKFPSLSLQVLKNVSLCAECDQDFPTSHILFPHILEHSVLLLHTKLLPSLEDGGGGRGKSKRGQRMDAVVAGHDDGLGRVSSSLL